MYVPVYGIYTYILGTFSHLVWLVAQLYYRHCLLLVHAPYLYFVQREEILLEMTFYMIFSGHLQDAQETMKR